MKDVEDLEAFRRWAIGNLLENRTRGLYAEWIVGRALGVVDPNQPRREWDASDLTYRDLLIEVKASGRGQAWPQDKPSTIRFGISPSKRPWFADSNTWVSHKEAERVADKEEAWEMTWGTAISIPVVLYLLYRAANWLLKALTGLELNPADLF